MGRKNWRDWVVVAGLVVLAFCFVKIVQQRDEAQSRNVELELQLDQARYDPGEYYSSPTRGRRF